MKNTISVLVNTITVFALFSAIALPVEAQAKCYGTYGQEIKCPVEEVAFTLIKTANKEKISVGETVEFTLTVKNVGAVKVDGVRVRDFLPTELEYVSGDINKIINSFGPGEVEEIKIVAKAQEGVVGDGGVKVVVNRADLTYEGIKLEAEASVVIEGGKVLAAVLPETSAGYELIGMLSGLLVFLGAGIKELSEKRIKL